MQGVEKSAQYAEICVRSTSKRYACYKLWKTMIVIQLSIVGLVILIYIFQQLFSWKWPLVSPNTTRDMVKWRGLGQTNPYTHFLGGFQQGTNCMGWFAQIKWRGGLRATSYTILKAHDHCNLRALIGRKAGDRPSSLHTLKAQIILHGWKVYLNSYTVDYGSSFTVSQTLIFNFFPSNKTNWRANSITNSSIYNITK